VAQAGNSEMSMLDSFTNLNWKSNSEMYS